MFCFTLFELHSFLTFILNLLTDPGKFGEILRDIYLSQHSEQNNISMIHQNNLSAERGQICEQRNQDCPPCNQRDIQSKSSEMENSQSASQEKVQKLSIYSQKYPEEIMNFKEFAFDDKIWLYSKYVGNLLITSGEDTICIPTALLSPQSTFTESPTSDDLFKSGSDHSSDSFTVSVFRDCPNQFIRISKDLVLAKEEFHCVLLEKLNKIV